jgi:prepilin-type N-terminal cleavage/methylation domain-containing protein
MSKISSGYSLVELLIVIFIMAIIFTFGMSNYRSFSQRQVLTNTAKNIQADIRLAQSEALSGHVPSDTDCTGTQALNGYAFKVTTSSQYQIIPVCSGAGTVAATKTVDLPSNVTITTPSPNPIIFKTLGDGTNIQSTDAKITIQISGSSNTLDVSISSGGQIE